MPILRILLIALLLVGLPSKALAYLCVPLTERLASSQHLTFGRVVDRPEPFEMEWQTYLSLRGSAPKRLRLHIYQSPVPTEDPSISANAVRRQHWHDSPLKAGDWAIMGFYEANGAYYHGVCAPALYLPPWLLGSAVLIPAALVVYKRRRNRTHSAS